MRPTEPIGSLGETVLKACRFAVVFKLLQGRLTNVDNGEPIKVLDLPRFGGRLRAWDQGI
jgi:hypothetical protein